MKHNIIARVEYVKFLGIMIDGNMNFRQHVETIVKKLEVLTVSCIVGEVIYLHHVEKTYIML